jgi:uncharacterized membrane protein
MSIFHDSAALLGGVGLGAGMMYFLDARSGARRRATLRDRGTHLMKAQADTASKGVRDLRNRSRGLMARARHSFEGAPSDRVLEQRVRSRLGRAVSHVSSIDVLAVGGRVILSGPVLESEASELVRTVERVRGVRRVDDYLLRFPSGERIPGLQGQGKARPRSMLKRDHWTPALRLVGGVAGGAAVLYGIGRRGPIGTGAAIGGGLVLVRSMADMPLRRMLGIGAGRRAVDLRKTMTIDAPVDEVYEQWARFDCFPRFMEHVKSVHVSDGGNRSHWKVEGPGGLGLSWDAEVTNRIEDELFAWRTVPGSAVEHAGIIRFEPVDGATRVDIRMSYNPPGGAIAHVVAALLGADPKRTLDQELVRFKSLLEEGRTRAHGHRVTREELHS